MLPPAIAPVHVVIVPIAKQEGDLTAIHEALDEQLWELTMGVKSERLGPLALPLVIKRDDDDSKSFGWRMTDRELKGAPITIAVGARDLASGEVQISVRDQEGKQTVAIDQLGETIVRELETMQSRLLDTSKTRREENTVSVDTRDEFVAALDESKFVLAHRDGTAETEEAIQELSKATIRCIPFDQVAEKGTCIHTGKPSTGRVIFARSY